MRKPNLLFIFSDQHAQRVMGCYGDKVVQTKNLDRIAAEGVRFENAYCPSPICVPSRMSMLTSRWPSKQKCWTNDDILASNLPTWPAAAGAAGAGPVLIGRMHAMGPDQLHGYADRLVGDHSPNWPGVQRHSMGVLEGTNDPNAISVTSSGAGGNAYQVKDRDVTDAAISWLQNDAVEQCESGKPFCLTAGYMLPHPPYVIDKEAYSFYECKVPPPRVDPAGSNEHPFHSWWRENRGIANQDAKATSRSRAAYWGMVHRLDEMIGELLAALEEIGELDNTLIVYSSDHGDHLGERGLWWKHTFFEESVKVPLLMRLPKVLPQGETRQQVVNLVDLSQTMLEAIDAPQLPNADGKSFWQVAQNGTTPWINETFSEYCTDAVPAWTGGRAIQQRMIRVDNWKLIFYDNEQPQLFNLENDPDELLDLSTSAGHAPIRDHLMARIFANWDAKEIAHYMKNCRVEKELMTKWASQVSPPGSQIWRFRPEINFLEP